MYLLKIILKIYHCTIFFGYSDTIVVTSTTIVTQFFEKFIPNDSDKNNDEQLPLSQQKVGCHFNTDSCRSDIYNIIFFDLITKLIPNYYLCCYYSMKFYLMKKKKKKKKCMLMSLGMFMMFLLLLIG